MRYPAPALERFWAKVRKTDECWLFNEARPSQRLFGVNYQKYAAHRWIFEQTFGRIPDGQVVIRTCMNPLCVRPSHLDLADVQPLSGIAASRAAQTHCKHGHELTPENIYRKSNGTRECRQCRARHTRERNARRSAKRKAAKEGCSK